MTSDRLAAHTWSNKERLKVLSGTIKAGNIKTSRDKRKEMSTKSKKLR